MYLLRLTYHIAHRHIGRQLLLIVLVNNLTSIVLYKAIILLIRIRHLLLILLAIHAYRLVLY